MLSEIRKVISDNKDSRITFLFGLLVATTIYEIGIGIFETYYLSVYDIIPLHWKTDCDRKLSFLQMYCFCDFISGLFSFALSFTCVSRNRRNKNLKNVVIMMAVPQLVQYMFGLVYLLITIEMETSCRDKLKIDAPEIWTIAIIHIITSCMFYLFLFVVIGIWVCKRYSILGIRNHADRLQIQEAILNSDPENINQVIV